MKLIDDLAAGLVGVVRGEPVRLLAVATALGSLLAFLGVDKTLLGLIGGVLTALLELARRIVFPATRIKDVATGAAAGAVARLDEAGIGELGAITETGADAVDAAVTETLAAVGIVPGRKHR